MSHKAGHIIIESAPPSDPGLAADVVASSRVEINFPAGMSIDDRIKKVRQVMRAIDKLDHPDESA